MPDFIASALGIKAEAVPPFLDPNLSDDQLLSGVSFASSGSGFDDLTTLAFKAIPVSKQIKLFRDYTRRIKGIVGEGKAKKIISGSLVVISAGTNDFIFNFYDIPTRRLEFTVGGYQDFLLDRLRSFVKELYELGCRKVIIAGLPPIGCLPVQMTLKFEHPLYRKCLEDQNSDAQSYNLKLSNLIGQWQPSLPCSKIIFADIYQPMIDMIDHPHEYAYCNITNFPSTILIFGDSTVDTGNNNYIKTLAKGNYLPYGQDFPGHIPTGRFSNGKLVPDFIASALGIKSEAVPPFLDPNLSDDQLLSGVSFASGGSGFDDLTTLASKAITVSKQIKLFRDYIRRIKGIVGEEKAKKIISGSLVVISAGFVETKRGCCGSGLIETAYLCNPTTPTCGNPSQFIFWDSIHPTQSVYQFLTQYLEIEILPKLLVHQSR
ncbi:hypothetical protein LWI28_018215 [Acer negundo]|uniref:GDSL esterase/lipase n=1 Tax=Acer negundo TaxID=4023 RepID=A0AAD5IAZ0_ACENE|nr:hypothetical protein LWI28_018215 [Acer negundo]